MSSESPFRSQPEELAALTKEIAEIRSVLRDLALRLGQIERHVKRAFGVKPTAKAKAKPSHPRLPVEPPTLSAKQALELFDTLVTASREQGGSAAEQRLDGLSLGDLRFLAHELGLPGGTKPSKRALVASILGRVKESLMLSRNTNVTQPRSASEPKPPRESS